MTQGEFSLIDTYFSQRASSRDDVVIGIGDDGAVVAIPENSQLVVVTDTMVEGVHFDAETPARAIGHKVAAVNLSDLAAMGAEPAWISLALTLPKVNDEWLAEFSQGLREICDYYGCQLIGGDTTQGPLTVTVTAQGTVPAGKALPRTGAKPGDWIFVSGTLGDAGLALAARQGRIELSADHLRRATERLYFPSPQVALGQSLRGVANSAVDVSDGLLADLKHIMKASNVGARLVLEEVPLSLALTESLPQNEALNYALTSGDDYELCFTVPESQRGVFDTLTVHSASKPVCIGRITNEPNQLELTLNGEAWQPLNNSAGYEHFHSTPSTANHKLK